jgi:ankyrin repeat protein
MPPSKAGQDSARLDSHRGGSPKKKKKAPKKPKAAPLPEEVETHQKLLDAVEAGQRVQVLEMLDSGVDVDVADWRGSSLCLAAEKGHADIATLLLERNADLEQTNEFGNNPLLVAAREGHIDIVRMLIEREADVNAVKQNGDTPFILSAAGGHIECAKLCLQRGADVNAVRKDGTSALLRAAEEGHLEMVKFCLQHGADEGATRMVEGSNPRNALMLAAAEAHADVVRLLAGREMALENERLSRRVSDAELTVKLLREQCATWNAFALRQKLGSQHRPASAPPTAPPTAPPAAPPAAPPSTAPSTAPPTAPPNESTKAFVPLEPTATPPTILRKYTPIVYP